MSRSRRASASVAVFQYPVRAALRAMSRLVAIPSFVRRSRWLRRLAESMSARRLTNRLRSSLAHGSPRAATNRGIQLVFAQRSPEPRVWTLLAPR